MKALVLTAGQGTRLRQLTRHRPKAMLPIGGKPLLEHILAWLRDANITDIALNLHHCPHAITRYFGDGSRWGVSLRYSEEERLLGTAGAAKRLQSFLDETFVVVYGDGLTNVNLGQLIHRHHLFCSQFPRQATITASLYRVPDPTQCGLVDLSPTGRILRFIEKPPADQIFTNLAFAGVMVCEPSILDAIPVDTEFDFGHDLFPRLLATGAPLWGSEIGRDEVIIDIGTLEGYLRALQTWTTLRAQAVI
jgi:NDP-sugar pyrophosphorylase family protein